jgi:hypothetical protein
MSTTQWYTVLGPYDWPGVKLETGNRRIDATYKNILSSSYVTLAASGNMYLVAGNSIRLITPGFVDASGVRVKHLYAENISGIDAEGNVVPRYIGPSGGIIYKIEDNNIAVNDDIIVDNQNNITLPNMAGGSPLWVDPSGQKLDTFGIVQYKPQEIIPSEDPDTPPLIIPPRVSVSGSNSEFICESIQIGQPFPAYRGSILTHTGTGLAQWAPAEYLSADGVFFNRYPKRAAYIFGRSENEPGNSILMIAESSPPWALTALKPSGAPDAVTNPDVLDINEFLAEQAAEAEGFEGTLKTEFGASDTLAIVRADTREVSYAKIAAGATFLITDSEDVETFVPELSFTNQSFKDSEEFVTQVYLVQICGEDSANGKKPGFDDSSNEGLGGFYKSTVSGVPDGAYYVYSVTKGAFLSMQMDPKATSRFYCGTDGVDEEYTFKPSTLNNISIRPDVSTAFNLLAENIDFAIYGKKNIEHNNFTKDVFGLDQSLLSTGLMPAFYVDANIPNAVKGNMVSGVFFDQYLDRDRTIPSGYILDDTAKVCIHTYEPYVIDSIVNSGVVDLPYYHLPNYLDTEQRETLFSELKSYASLTVKGVTYSDEIVTSGIYFIPKPASDNTSEYIANALMTIDRNGKLIPRIPRPNPTAPAKPSGLTILRQGNSDVSLNWKAPADGGKEVLNYIIEFSVNEGGTWTEVPLENINRGLFKQTSATINNLDIGLEYYFAITAQNSIGIGERSDLIYDPDGNVLTTPYESNPSAPSAPSMASGNRFFGPEDPTQGTSYLDLFWQAPSSNGMALISGYIIEESMDLGKTWIYHNSPNQLINDTNLVDLDDGSTWYQETIYGLKNGINYLHRISAINASGQSSYYYIYSTGNIPPEDEEEFVQRQREEEEEVLSNWDFGQILFTGVCVS